jgi:hypothetical protein
MDKPEVSIRTLREILEGSRSSELETPDSFNDEDPNVQLFEVVREFGVEYLGRARAGDTVWLSRKLEMIVLGDAAFQNVRVLDGCARHAMFVNPALAAVKQLGDIQLDAPLSYLFHIPDHEDWEFKFLRFDFPPTNIRFFPPDFFIAPREDRFPPMPLKDESMALLFAAETMKNPAVCPLILLERPGYTNKSLVIMVGPSGC